MGTWGNDWRKDSDKTPSGKGKAQAKDWNESWNSQKTDRPTAGRLASFQSSERSSERTALDDILGTAGGPSENEIDTFDHVETQSGDPLEKKRMQLTRLKATATAAPTPKATPKPAAARPSSSPSVSKALDVVRALAAKRQHEGEGWSGRPWKASREDAEVSWR